MTFTRLLTQLAPLFLHFSHGGPDYGLSWKSFEIIGGLSVW